MHIFSSHPITFPRFQVIICASLNSRSILSLLCSSNPPFDPSQLVRIHALSDYTFRVSLKRLWIIVLLCGLGGFWGSSVEGGSSRRFDFWVCRSEFCLAIFSPNSPCFGAWPDCPQRLLWVFLFCHPPPIFYCSICCTVDCVLRIVSI